LPREEPLENRQEAPWLIVQARMGSTRLPGKVMLEVMGRPLLAYLIERLKRVKNAKGLLIATTELSDDDVIAAFAKSCSLPVFRGSVDDVLSRYYLAASSVSAKSVVRITADCPLIDPEIIDEAIELYKSATPPPDYVSNSIKRTYPRGMDVELFSFKALSRAFFEAVEPFQKEHVTPFIYRHRELFHCLNFEYGTDASRYRLTVDTREDFVLIELLLNALYPQKNNFTLKDLLDLITLHPEWAQINASVLQKEI